MLHRNLAVYPITCAYIKSLDWFRLPETLDSNADFLIQLSSQIHKNIREKKINTNELLLQISHIANIHRSLCQLKSILKVSVLF